MKIKSINPANKSIIKDDLISGIPAKNHKKRIKQEAVINR